MVNPHPIAPSHAHLEEVPDFRPVSYFTKKASALGITAHTKGKQIHIFRVICSDSRGRSQRLVNAGHVVHEIYKKAGNSIHTHTIEVAGATMFPDQIENIRNQMKLLVQKFGPEKVEFQVEVLGHSEIVDPGKKYWTTNPKCKYHCGFTHGDTVAEELEKELIGERISGKTGQWKIRDKHDLAQFMLDEYNFHGPFSGQRDETAYIHGIPDPKAHVAAQYEMLVDEFSGLVDEKNIATYVHDFRNHHLERVSGGRNLYSQKVHALAELELGVTPYSKRIEGQSPEIMAITHPEVQHRSTVPLILLSGLGPQYAPGRVFVNAVYGIGRGIVGPSTQAGIYYYAKHLKGKVLHVRGRNDQETAHMVKALQSDPITSVIIRKYKLKIASSSHAEISNAIDAMHGKAA